MTRLVWTDAGARTDTGAPLAWADDGAYFDYEPRAAAASQTIPDFTQTATLTAPAAASASQTVPAFTQTATLTGTVSASASQTVPAFTQSATLAAPIALSADQTIPAFEQTATLELGAIPGQILPTGTGLGGSLRRKRRPRQITGAASITFRPPFWLVADGEIGEPPEGDFTVRFTLPVWLAVSAAAGVAGEGRAVASIDAGAYLAAAGFIAPCGDVRATVTPFCRGTGRHDHFSDAELALLPLLLEL